MLPTTMLRKLDSALLEMNVEMPTLNLNYTAGQRDKGFDLKSTLDLANEEHPGGAALPVAPFHAPSLVKIVLESLSQRRDPQKPTPL